jgi:hypothetical protein
MAGLKVVKKAEPTGASLVETKDSETGWHLELKKAEPTGANLVET